MPTVTISDDNLGDCAKCLRRPAKHKVYRAFTPPIKSSHPTLPDIEGVYEYLCDDCVPSNLNLLSLI